MLSQRLKGARIAAAGATPVLRSPAVTRFSDTLAAATFSLNVPSHSPGDYLYVFLTVNAAAFVTSIPAGWTLLGSATATAERLGVYYKVASGSEPASYSWTVANAYAVVSFAVGNVVSQTLGTIGVSGGTAFNVSVPAVTTYSNGLLFMLACIDNTGTVTSYTSPNYTFTQRASVGGSSNAGTSAFAVNTTPTTTSGNSSGTGDCSISVGNGLAAVFLAVGP